MDYKDRLYIQAETHDIDEQMLEEEIREKELLEEDLRLERAWFTRVSLQEEMYDN